MSKWQKFACGRLHLIVGAIEAASEGDKVIFYSSSHSDWGAITPAWASRNEILGHPNEQFQRCASGSFGNDLAPP
jgi:hypothetical protein